MKKEKLLLFLGLIFAHANARNCTDIASGQRNPCGAIVLSTPQWIGLLIAICLLALGMVVLSCCERVTPGPGIFQPAAAPLLTGTAAPATPNPQAAC